MTMVEFYALSCFCAYIGTFLFFAWLRKDTSPLFNKPSKIAIKEHGAEDSKSFLINFNRKIDKSLEEKQNGNLCIDLDFVRRKHAIHRLG